jgi:hypothetical protein
MALLARLHMLLVRATLIARPGIACIGHDALPSISLQTETK